MNLTISGGESVSLISTGKKQIRNLQRQAERQLLVAAAKTKTRNNSKKPILLGATNSAGQANSWAVALRKSGRAAQSLQIVSDEQTSWFNADRTINRTQWKPLEFRKQLLKKSPLKIVVFFWNHFARSSHLTNPHYSPLRKV